MDPAPDLTALMHRFYQAFNAGDAAFMRALIAQQEGALVIGTDPAEWWTGHGEVTRKWAVQFEEMAGITITSRNLMAHSEGTVGWVADQPSFRLPDGSELPLRLTVVFHREGSDWKLVQLHASVGMANEEAIGMQLTT